MVYETRLKQRLAFLRGKQKELALQHLENNGYSLYTGRIGEVLPAIHLLNY